MSPGGQGCRIGVGDLGQGVAVLGPKVWPGQLGGRLRVDSPLGQDELAGGFGPAQPARDGLCNGLQQLGMAVRCGSCPVRCPCSQRQPVMVRTIKARLRVTISRVTITAA